MIWIEGVFIIEWCRWFWCDGFVISRICWFWCRLDVFYCRIWWLVVMLSYCWFVVLRRCYCYDVCLGFGCRYVNCVCWCGFVGWCVRMDGYVGIWCGRLWWFGILVLGCFGLDWSILCVGVGRNWYLDCLDCIGLRLMDWLVGWLRCWYWLEFLVFFLFFWSNWLGWLWIIGR